jgi:hypothetical protein
MIPDLIKRGGEYEHHPLAFARTIQMDKMITVTTDEGGESLSKAS